MSVRLAAKDKYKYYTPVMMMRWQEFSSFSRLKIKFVSLFTGVTSILLITSLSKGSGELTSLTLIHNENFPARCFLENRYEILLASDSLIRCHENMILRPRRSRPRELMEKLILLHNLPGLLFSMERNDT